MKLEIELSGEHEATLVALCGLAVVDGLSPQEVAQRLMEMQLESPIWRRLIGAKEACLKGIAEKETPG